MINYKQHLEEIRKIFELALSKGTLSTALRAKMLEMQMQKDRAKADHKIHVQNLSETELDELIRELQKECK